MVQIVTFTLIVFFIKNEGDALKYTLIQALGLVCSQISVWLFIPKYIHPVKVSVRDSFYHLKGSLEYFIPQIAVILYTNLNKTLLGFSLGVLQWAISLTHYN